jgi:hypothetical protein
MIMQGSKRVEFKKFQYRGSYLDKSYDLCKPENLVNCTIVKTDDAISFLDCIKANFDECYPNDGEFNLEKASMPLWKYAKELGKTLWLDMSEVEEIHDFSYFTDDQRKEIVGYLMLK